MYVSKLWLLCDGLHLRRGRLAAASSDDIAIELELLNPYRTLRRLRIELMLLKSREDHVEVLHILFIGVRIDHNIVQVNNDELPDEIS